MTKRTRIETADAGRAVGAAAQRTEAQELPPGSAPTRYRFLNQKVQMYAFMDQHGGIVYPWSLTAASANFAKPK